MTDPGSAERGSVAPRATDPTRPGPSYFTFSQTLSFQ
jgi:hypothetical protein